MYKNDIEDLITRRMSTRTYSDKMVNEEDREALLEFTRPLECDLYRFAIVDYAMSEGKKLNTYGLIRNAKTLLVAIGRRSLARDNKAAVDFGYDFEKIILKATDLGIDTCWMGMSYKEDALRELAGVGNDERIVMASPIGYSKGDNILDKLTRYSIKAHKRLSFESIFSHGKIGVPLTELKDERYRICLEMLRRSPSAGNAQPWRVVQTEGGFDFYSKAKKIYDNLKDKRIDFTYNDMGIAKCHFELTALKYNLKGSWYKKEDVLESEFKYVYSYKIEGK